MSSFVDQNRISEKFSIAQENYLYLRGINSQGGGGSQHDPKRVPGKLGTDYHFNSQKFYDYLASRGHKIIRLDFLWERIQPKLDGPLDPEKLNELKDAVSRVGNAGMVVLLDMKNYARYWQEDDTQLVFGDGLTADQFANVWQRLAEEFKDDSTVVAFGLMNEPHSLPKNAPHWKIFSQTAVNAIRETGYKRMIFVAGDQWSAMWNWSSTNGEPWITDPANNIVYEAHLYFDHD